MEPSEKKSRKDSVKVSTFKKWDFGEDFQYAVDGDGYVTNLKCKVCYKYLSQIKEQARCRKLRGQIVKGLESYTIGVNYIHKNNLSTHVKSGGLHDWAKNKFESESDTPDSTNTTSSASVVGTSSYPKEKGQRNMLCMYEKKQPNYIHLFNTALYVVKQERPFTDFEGLVDLQKTNGIKFEEGKLNDKACASFISYMADTMREDISAILGSLNFYATAEDGSQARKTGSEKELVYMKTVIRGQPIELLLKCVHMDDYGSDAADLKEAFDDVFNKEYKMDEKRFQLLLISNCADGASVNMGRYKGACTLMKTEDGRDWLLVIHCGAHRLELALADAFKTDDSFQAVDDMSLSLFLHFRNSGKQKRLIKLIAYTLGVAFVTFPKSAGTRFQNHKYRAVKALIINFLPLINFIESVISGNPSCKAEVVSKLKGYKNKMLKYKFLASLHLYRQVLQATAHLSYVMQTKASMVTDIVDNINETKQKLTELQITYEVELPFPIEVNDAECVQINAEATNLPTTMKFKQQNKMSEKEKRRLLKRTIVQKSIEVTHVTQGKQGVQKIKTVLLESIIEQLEKRLDSFEQDDVFKSMTISDNRRWNYLDPAYGMNDIDCLTKHFQRPLSYHQFSIDKAKYEFRELKKLVCSRYKHLQPTSLWETIFTSHHASYKNFLLLIEIILVIFWSSATVERGFSVVNRQLTNSRLNMNKITLNDIMILRVNIPILNGIDPNYEVKLVEKAVKKYLESVRYRTKTKMKKVIPSRCEANINSEDLFLPVPSSALSDTNPLLSNDDDLLYPISDDGESTDGSDDDESSKADTTSNSDSSCDDAVGAEFEDNE